MSEVETIRQAAWTERRPATILHPDSRFTRPPRRTTRVERIAAAAKMMASCWA
jgi:hypothetical protein